jgi:hypothetical protein
VKSFGAPKKWHRGRHLTAGSWTNRPSSMVGPGRNWLLTTGGWPAVQEWHGAGDAVVRDTAGTMWYKGSRKGRHSRGVIRCNRKATMA